jgi:lipoate---protein ligase
MGPNHGRLFADWQDAALAMPLRVIDLGSSSATQWQTAAYVIADRVAPGGAPAVVFADPLEPFLSVGANQNIGRDIDLSFCRDRGITLVRRRLGGSAIYIDPEQLIFHIIVPARGAHWPVPRMPATLAAAVVDTHRDLGIAASLRPPGDIAVGGRKIGGTAGAEIGGSVVVGGTFLFGFDAAIMARCLKLPSEPFRAKVARVLERGMTTMRDELGAPPDRGLVKAHLVANLARRLDAEPQEDRMTDEESAAIAIATQRLEDAARRD